MFIGKGIQIWKRTGAKYEGDWREDKRHGYGMYSVPNKDKPGEMQKRYAGGWKNDLKHVRIIEAIYTLHMCS